MIDLTGLEVKLAMLNARLHAIEQIILKNNPELKDELEKVFTEEMKDIDPCLKDTFENNS